MTAEEFKAEALPLKHKVFRLAYTLLQNREEAEDAAQEVFLRLWKKRGSLNEYRSIEAFTMVITKNFCLDMLRSKRHKIHRPFPEDIPEKGLTPYGNTEANDSSAIVRSIINGLPDLQKIIVRLRDVEGYEYGEIAEITGMNENAVRVNLCRARQKIRETLYKEYNYEQFQT